LKERRKQIFAMKANMPISKICLAASASGWLLLIAAGILVFTHESPALNAFSQDVKTLEGRFLTAAYATHDTGLSGTPSSSSEEGSFGRSFENHSSSGGKDVVTIRMFGFAGGEIVAYIIATFFSMMYAWMYYLQVVAQIEPLPPQPETGSDDFEVGIFDCICDACTCLSVIIPCAAWTRQAHTNEVTGVCPFWPTWCAYFCTGIFCGVGPCCLTVFFRMRLKEHMGVEDHVLNDLCLSWLCHQCAIGQQAMAVDQALGYEVECCCTLRWTTPTEKVYKDGTVGGYERSDLMGPGYDSRDGHIPRF
jgi:Cys-rich protein (TIGR01571 family)